MGTHTLVSTQRAPHIPQNKTHTLSNSRRVPSIYNTGETPRELTVQQKGGGAEYKLGLSAAHREEGEVPNTLPVLKPATIPTLT